MNRKHWSNLLHALLLICAVSTSLLYLRAQATTADISSIPMGTRSGSNVAPNLMFILDDSGSMDNNYLPDGVGDDTLCKVCSGGSCTTTGATCSTGTPPFNAYDFNTISYNPSITYSPGVDYLNATLGNANPAAARDEPYSTSDTSTTNVATGYTDIYWCLSTVSSTASAATLNNTANCKRNGVDNTNPFNYATAGFPNATFVKKISKSTFTPYYYTITPKEYCTDENLVTCTLSAVPVTVSGTTYSFPAPVRWCRTTGAVDAAAAVSGNSFSGSGARDCQALTDSTYAFPRFGTFSRVNIVTGTSYARPTTRTDCTGAVGPTGCSDVQELQNFANWYWYYRYRLQMMKTVPGRVFASIGNDPNAGAIRVGFVTINASSSSRYLKIDDFKNNTHRQNWFNKIYGITTTNSTPLREALSRVGRHFAGKTTGINSFMPDEPMIASCQRNYAFLVTDGYWNGNAGQNLAGAAVGDQDDAPSASVPVYVDRATTVTLDGLGTVTTTVTPNTILEQIVCTGNASVTASFAGGSTVTATCGCGVAQQKRIKQRTRTFNTTLIQTDNAGGTPTNSSNTDTYQDITACALPLIVTTVTPSTVVDEQVVTGTANSTFAAVNGVAAGANQAGVCPGAQQRIKRRTTNYNTTVVTTDGVVTSSTASGTTYTFADPGTCATVVTTTATPVTLVEQQVLTGNATSTFSAIGGVAAGANSAGVCTGGLRRAKQRTTTYTSTVVTTDGVAAAATLSAVTYAFTDPGTCVTQITTVDTPVTVTEQLVLTGNATSTFAVMNGLAAGANQAGVCTGGQRRVKQRVTTYTSRVITTDGVAAPATVVGGSTAYTFSNPGSCVSVVTTVDTPVTITEQQVLTGGASSTFAVVNGVASNSNSAGVCTGGQQRVKQRVTTYTSRVVTTDGVAGPATPLSDTTYAFTNPGSCASVVTTANTPVTVVEEQLVTASNLSTFAIMNGVAANANQAGTCSAGQSRIKRRTTTYTSQVITTDGVAAPATAVAGTTSYVFANPGACVTTTNTVVTTDTETAQWESTSEGTNLATGFSAALNGTNVQTTFTCTGAGTNTLIVQRVITYTKTVTTVGAGAPTTTRSASASTNFSVVNPCNTSGKSAAATTVSSAAVSNTTTGGPTPAATTTTNGTTTSSTSGSYPTAAATTNSNGTPTSSTVGVYPTAAATTTTNGTASSSTVGVYPTAAATTTTNGTPTSNTTGAYPTAAAPTTTNGAPTTSNNGGTTQNIGLAPNPNPSVGAGVTTTALGGSADTLADVAMYYYKTDLRSTGTFSKDNVPTSGKYIAPHQHMITFTMGLGLDGLMNYRDDYESATAGDFFNIKSGATTCLWTTGTCNWPTPAPNAASAIDDLWHAAVNGRGKYFSARAPVAAENGIKETLASINVATGSAAAAATSTPNLTTTNNSLYSSTYRTVNWDGEIVARTLDPTTGILNPTINWSASTQLNAQGLAASDTRTIYTFDGGVASKLKPFLYANLTPTEATYFDGKCTAANWNQCTFIAADAPRLAAANSGANLINYLRGQSGNQLSADNSSGLFRRRTDIAGVTNILGDTVNSKPAYMPPPELQFQDAVTPSYGTFATANANRQKTLFVAANDGMLHAFNADTGAEMWAYIPKMILPNLYKLANSSYGNAHAFYVDGSPTVTDVFIGGAWKTVLVGGFNSGGRGFYALDVTDPAAPKALWEICSDATLCALTDTDMGLTYGVPVIGKRPADGKWVVLVTSGYNNIGPGSGGGFLYMLDIATGAVLEKVGTTIAGVNVGDSTTPSGFAKINAVVSNFISDNTMTLVYGGDLLGNMWRFDLATSPPTVQRIAQLKDGTGKPQSITTRPDITHFTAGFNVIYVGTGRFLGDSDLGDPAALGLPFSYQQSVYAFKDTNTDLGNLRLAAAQLVQQSLTVVDAATRGISNNSVIWTTNNGWYVDLNPHCVAAPGCSGAAEGESPGERVNLDVQLVRGTLVVIGNEPNGEQCSSGGDSFLYQFDYSSGSYIAGTPGGVVGTKIGNTLSVGIVVFQTLGGTIKSVITTSDGSLPQAPINTAGTGGAPSRAAWRELLDTRTNSTDTPQ